MKLRDAMLKGFKGRKLINGELFVTEGEPTQIMDRRAFNDPDDVDACCIVGAALLGANCVSTSGKNHGAHYNTFQKAVGHHPRTFFAYHDNYMRANPRRHSPRALVKAFFKDHPDLVDLEISCETS